MPVTNVEVCNLAQDLLGGEALASIDAPRSANEKRYARNYPQIRDAELTKRRWNFARQHFDITPTGEPVVTDLYTFYRYAYPGNGLRPIRESRSDWQVAQRQLLSQTNGTLKVWFVIRAPEVLWHPCFTDMVVARLAFTLCEAVTQSNEKKADATAKYETARREAQMLNAFELAPEAIADNDAAFSWVQARYA